MRDVDRRRIIEQGYDELDDTYRDWVQRARNGYRSEFLAKVLARVPRGARVLEIGCGPGTDAEALADDRRYTGVDLSGVQLEHARRAVPTGTFLHADVLDIGFPPSSFDAVVSVYVFNHVPQGELHTLFGRIYGWTSPGGWFCASFGTSDNPGEVQPMWLGRADMYFSSLPPEANDRALEIAGFRIGSAETVTEVEEGQGPATFHWVLARKPHEQDGGSR